MKNKYLIIGIAVILVVLLGRTVYLNTNYPYKRLIGKIAKEKGLSVSDYSFEKETEYDWYNVELNIEGKEKITDSEWYEFVNELPSFEVMDNNSYSLAAIYVDGVLYDKEGLNEEQREYYTEFCEKLRANDYKDLDKYKDLISPDFNSIGFIVDNSDVFERLTNGSWNAEDSSWEYKDYFKWEYYENSKVLGFFIFESEYADGMYMGDYEDAIYSDELQDLINGKSVYIKGNDHDDWVIDIKNINDGYFIKEYPSIEYSDNTLKFINAN